MANVHAGNLFKSDDNSELSNDNTAWQHNLSLQNGNARASHLYVDSCSGHTFRMCRGLLILSISTGENY